MGKPKIRFRGYTEDWEQRKLNEIADKVSEKNKNNEFSEPFTNSAEQGIISQKDYFDREIVNNENLNGYYIVRNDDFIYNPRISVTAPVGPINRNRLGRNGVMSPLYTVFRTHDIDNLYLEFYFKTMKWHRFMKLNGDSGARFDRFTISSTQFMEMPIPYPTLEEQQKIGEYFDSLDHFITLHQRKCEETKKLKKYMLQKMFPKNGQKIPEIRFSGFTEDWEQRKVFDLLELLTDYDANGSFADMAKNVNTTDGDGYAWYVRITDLENPKPLKELKYVDESSYKFLKKTELHGGELLMAKRGDIGKVYIFEPRTKYATVAPNMYLLKLNDKVIPHFLYDYFVSNEGNKKLTRLNASSTMGALYKDDVKNIDVIMPSIEEQAMIGNFFQSIDHFITLHQHKQKYLKKH